MEEVILTLDDGIKYVVVDRIKYNDTEYIYLVDINNSNNLMICEINNNKLKK